MHDHENGCCARATALGSSGPGGLSTRRRFLTLAALGGGMALLSATPLRHASANGDVEAVLLSCMDYRLVDSTVRYMNQRGMSGRYDHLILAGASLGVLTDKEEPWQKTFWEHVQVAKDLHHIHKVIVMDHRDCGAYRVFLGVDLKDDPVRETEVHGEHLSRLSAAIKQKHPDLEVETLLMSLDGSVEAFV